MLTPIEIEKHSYKKGFRGYSSVEVDEFMQVVCEDYEKLYKENIVLRDKINILSNAVKQYKSMEETLQNAIIVAQSTGEEITKNAREKADNIIREAENQAGKILNDAGKEVTKVSYEYEKMKRNVEVFRTKIISLLTSQLDIVKEFSTPENEEAGEIAESMPEVLAETETMSEKNVQETLKKLERVTKELPKLVLNENGEYVAAEETDGGSADDYDEELGF